MGASKVAMPLSRSAGNTQVSSGTPGTIAAQSDTFRYADGQWAAWDAYVENVRYRLGWSTQQGQGQYEAPKGRSFTSAAMDARGRYVAASTTRSLNIGSIKDTVVALRTNDGREVFRKVVNISSVSGTGGNAGQVNYATAKAGIIGMTKTLAKEWGRYKVNVNCVALRIVL